MSLNRENVIWKSRDGTWSIGFYDFHQTGEDYEWDVDYDMSRFNWASIGHASEMAATKSWTGCNPGCCMVYEEPSDLTDKLDWMAAEWLSETRPDVSGWRGTCRF